MPYSEVRWLSFSQVATFFHTDVSTEQCTANILPFAHMIPHLVFFSVNNIPPCLYNTCKTVAYVPDFELKIIDFVGTGRLILIFSYILISLFFEFCIMLSPFANFFSQKKCLFEFANLIQIAYSIIKTFLFFQRPRNFSVCIKIRDLFVFAIFSWSIKIIKNCYKQTKGNDASARLCNEAKACASSNALL